MDSNPVARFLTSHGPALSSDIAEWLVEQGLSPEAARKRISRAQPPIRAFPVPIFPKNTRFMYLEHQRMEERFWEALQRALRNTGSVYGMALDGVLARGGAVAEKDFAVVSGATVYKVKKQVLAETVLERLLEARLVTLITGDERVVAVSPMAIDIGGADGVKARGIVERIILDGLREWARNIGAASYNTIRIRGEPDLQPVQQFQFDLASPSYLMSLRRGKGATGFLVADVFSAGVLNEFHIQYFIRKAHALHASLKGATVLPILVADGFTGEALTAGHKAGILIATPSTLFGPRVGVALRDLVETLTRAAAYASSGNADRLIGLIGSLSVIEGRAGNLRGTLFELMSAYLARRDAVSIDMGIRAVDPATGAKADIDVLKVTQHHAQCVAIECKGREPGGFVTEEDVGEWLGRIATITKYLRAQERFRESDISFELWTSGEFTPDALKRLNDEKIKRTRYPIGWLAGRDVLGLAQKHKEKAMADAIAQHFLQHPLVMVKVDDSSAQSKDKTAGPLPAPPAKPSLPKVPRS